MKTLLYSVLLLPTYIFANATFIHPFPSPGCDAGAEPFSLEERLPVAKKEEAKSLRERIIERSKGLEGRLLKKIFGQPVAVRETAEAIIRFAAGINDPLLPISTFLYCGPSGVGKTELAKELCQELYGGERHFIRINMSEYNDEFTMTRLLGSPPGYIGSDQGGILSNRLLECPFSVVLLDEIEKAHPKILKLFLHIFDAGYFTSAMGEDIDCTKAIFLMTSNLASSEIVKMHEQGFNQQEILQLIQPFLMEVLSPEMFNRLDVVLFAPLSDEVYELLIKKVLGSLRERINKVKGIDVIFDQTVIDYLRTFPLDPRLGARPLKRLVDRQLATILAKAILEKTCKKGDTLICSFCNGNIVIEIVFQED